jgi:hypothetical protein
MNIYLLIASSLIFILAIAHSVLGELKILRHLKNVNDLPALNGIPLLWKNTNATRHTIRMVWHLATVLAFCIAAVLCKLAMLNSLTPTEVCIVITIGVSMLISCLAALLFTKGNHASWIAFLVIGILSLMAVC